MKHACKLSSGRLMGRRPFFVTCDYSRKPKPAHCNIWVNMLQGYCRILDPSIDNINSQPHVSMNLVKSRLDENWEYVKYELSFLEFKAQVNVDLKNKRHDLKLLIESGVGRPDDCELEHWETIKWHIASEAKQGKAAGIVPCRHLSPLQVTLVVVVRCEGFLE